jgi:S1-C subfamily serine protease
LYAAQVVAGSPAAMIGLQQGDIITAVSGETTRDLPAFYNSLREKADRELWFNIIRGNTTLTTLNFRR